MPSDYWKSAICVYTLPIAIDKPEAMCYHIDRERKRNSFQSTLKFLSRSKSHQKGGDKMDEQRMGQIALAISRDRARKEPIFLGQETKRGLGNAAKRMNISLDELKIFTRTLIQEAVDETFGS